LEEIHIPKSSDGIEILYLAASKDQNKIGVVLGKRGIKHHLEIIELVVYHRDSNGEFELERLIDFPFHEACMQFDFDKKSNDHLIFFSNEEVFRYNYVSEEKQTIYTYKNPLEEQPTFGVFNEDQTKFMVTSDEDIIFVNIKTGREIDFDEREGLGNIQNIIHDE